MRIQNCSEDTILVELTSGLEIGEDLKTIIETVQDEGNRNVILDFFHVDIVTSSSLAKLLKIHTLLTDSGHQLILCGVAPPIRGIFTVTSLDNVFEIVADKSAAMASLQTVS